MKQKFYSTIKIIVILMIVLVSGCVQQPKKAELVKGPVIVKQTGAAALLPEECADKEYLTKTADFIVEGTIQKVESKWNDDKTEILTYSDLAIKNYLKGDHIEDDRIQIVTSGGCVGEVCQWVEDQPTLQEGKNVRIYFHEITGVIEGKEESIREFFILCGAAGVEEIEMSKI